MLPPLQAFLLPTPQQCDLQMDQGPALQQRRLSQLLQGTVFPEFVSDPSSPSALPPSARAQPGAEGTPVSSQSPRAQLGRQSQERVTRSSCSP